MGTQSYTGLSVIGYAGAALAILLLAGGALSPSAGHAIPLFARQTALPCGRCHAVVPELNSFGRRFKLAGYTFSSIKYKKIPISVFTAVDFASTSKDVPDPPSNADPNDDFRVEQVKVFTGGAITKSAGALVSAAYCGVTDDVSLKTVDLRYIENTYVNGTNVLFGVSVNNDPVSQDPWNSNLVRTWPYFVSTLEPVSRTQVVLDRGFSQRVIGGSPYVFIDDTLYLEVAAYAPLGDSVEDFLGYDDDRLELDGAGIYARIAKEIRLPKGSFSFGAFLFDAEIERSLYRPAYSALDIAVDAFYQRKQGPHLLTVGSSFVREFIDSGSSRSKGLASRRSNHLNRISANVRYVYNSTYGGGLGVLSLTGSKDPLFYGTLNGEPDTTSLRLDLFWNPLSKRPPAFYPWLRTRLGLQYAHFFSFDGRGSDYDVNGRDASDNDTVTLYWLLAF